MIFLLLLVVLWRWGWGMLIEKLDDRDHAIRGAIDEARSEREQATALLAEHKALLDKTRRETAEMLATAQADAKRERQRILDEARAEYEKILARGREQIEQETRAALAQIRGTVADLALEVAGKVLSRSMGDASIVAWRRASSASWKGTREGLQPDRGLPAGGAAGIPGDLRRPLRVSVRTARRLSPRYA
ncbi:MAG: F0F1 ATP synthase subunit B [Acidobacteriota bacterium]|nr:F0F1 ATP synthase subunit B [Acidobacteriota bacterium]